MQGISSSVRSSLSRGQFITARFLFKKAICGRKVLHLVPTKSARLIQIWNISHRLNGNAWDSLVSATCLWEPPVHQEDTGCLFPRIKFTDVLKFTEVPNFTEAPKFPEMPNFTEVLGQCLILNPRETQARECVRGLIEPECTLCLTGLGKKLFQEVPGQCLSIIQCAFDLWPPHPR